MSFFPEQFKKTIDYFSKLPGVGEKTATRQTLILSHWDKEKLLGFSKALAALTELSYCPDCHLFKEPDAELCFICADQDRSALKTLCIVESLTDCMAIERSGTFKGLFHVLGGVLNPLIGIGPNELKLDLLMERIKRLGIEEIILAINPSVEGDATCSYIKMQLSDAIKIERIGFGIPMGGSLEYLDSVTISKALENRKSL